MKKGQGLISEWVESFIVDRRIQNVSPGTMGFYREKLGKFVKWSQEQGLTQVTDLTPHHLRLFLIYLEDLGHNAGGRHCYFRALRTLLIFFEEEVEPDGWKNPIRRIKAPRLPQKPLNPVSNEEVSSLVEVCNTSSFYGTRDKAIFMVLLDTGLRASELLDIDFEDINLIEGSILIRKGKGSKVRIVFYGKKTKKALRLWVKKRPQNTIPLFTTKRGERLKYSGLRQILKRRSKNAGISNVSLHDFRRAFCLGLLNQGVPETSIARFMGHANTQLIAIYAKQTTRNLQQVYYSIGDNEL